MYGRNSFELLKAEVLFDELFHPVPQISGEKTDRRKRLFSEHTLIDKLSDAIRDKTNDEAYTYIL